MNEKYPLALNEGSVLAGQYIIEKVLGQGGFGITYQAKDHKSGGKVAVKEYFPDSLVTRNRTTVIPFTGERGEGYQYGKECFLKEAETLGRFIGNENIVRIHSYFEENGTAYFVMDFVEGTSFDDYIRDHGGKLSFDETARILIPVMDALNAVHAKGIIHRDVTPDNIYITRDGIVKLLDFGAARYSIGEKSRSLDVVLKHGFAPKEQYTRHGKQGPFTDIYALGATFYFALTGKRPPDSIDRIDEDNLVLPSVLGVTISKEAENAILKALAVQPGDRYQTMADFKREMLALEGKKDQITQTEENANVELVPENNQQGSDSSSDPKVLTENTDGLSNKEPAKDQLSTSNNKAIFIVLGVVAVTILGAVIYYLNNSYSNAAYDYSSDISSRVTDSFEESGASSSYSSDQAQEVISEEPTTADAVPEEITGSETRINENESDLNLYPKIKGNYVNNIIFADCISPSGGVRLIDEDNERNYATSISEVDGNTYAIHNSNDKSFAVVINNNSEKAIEQLSNYNNIKKLFVSDEYYFVFDNNYLLSCISKKDGHVVYSKELSYYFGFNFCNGYLVYIDGEKGNQKVMYTPAGDLSKSDTYCELESDIYFDGVFYGGNSYFYVLGSYDSGYEMRKFDLSKDIRKDGFIGHLSFDEEKIGKIIRINILENDDIFVVRQQDQEFYISRINFDAGILTDIYKIPNDTEDISGFAICQQSGRYVISIILDNSLFVIDKDTGELLAEINN